VIYRRHGEMEVFNDYAYYYNAFYKDKDYKAEAIQVDSLLKKYGKDIHKIINFGCGTGKHDIELTKLGYQCTGIDLSPLMIGIARENVKNSNSDISFSVADIRNYESSCKYDAVISLFHVMSYQNANSDILLTFQSARKILNVGGCLCLMYGMDQAY
jgi:SAM-dependent methyltransferase